jgi:hypothetical protein
MEVAAAAVEAGVAGMLAVVTRDSLARRLARQAAVSLPWC